MSFETIKCSAVLVVFLNLGCREDSTSLEGNFSMPIVAKAKPASKLKVEEVIALFHERSSRGEIDEFRRLVSDKDEDRRRNALEMLLFKLKSEELFDLGINQTEYKGHFSWALATSRGFTDKGRAFEEALRSVGVGAGATINGGIICFVVPREQFFVARAAILQANIPTNEIEIVTPSLNLSDGVFNPDALPPHRPLLP